MPELTVSVATELSIPDVIRVLTDFGPTRAQVWPGVDTKHFQLHGSGPAWADVTEGNSFAWERARYEWDPAGDSVEATTTDSNLWGPGSGWKFRVAATDHGTVLEVTAIRVAKNLKGTLVLALLRPFGRKLTANTFSRALLAYRRAG